MAVAKFKGRHFKWELDCHWQHGGYLSIQKLALVMLCILAINFMNPYCWRLFWVILKSRINQAGIVWQHTKSSISDLIMVGSSCWLSAVALRGQPWAFVNIMLSSRKKLLSHDICHLVKHIKIPLIILESIVRCKALRSCYYSHVYKFLNHEYTHLS